MEERIRQAIKDVLEEEFSLDPAQVTDDLVLRDIPGIESLRILRMVVRLEKALDVEIPDERIFDVTTAGDLARILRSELDSQRGAAAPV